MARNSTVTLKNGRYVHYSDWNLHINPKAHKLWAAHVTDYDPSTKWNWVQDFLDTTTLDGDQHYDVAGIQEGDVLRVKAASHGNDKTTCMVVTEKGDDEMVCEHLSDEDAIERVQDDDSDERDELVREIETLLADCSTGQLTQIRDHIQMLHDDTAKDVTITVREADYDK